SPCHAFLSVSRVPATPACYTLSLHDALPISSGTEQSRVQHVRPVGSRHDDNARVGTETVHFYQQLVQCILTLVITPHHAVFAPGTANGIDFIDKDYTRSLILGLPEEVAHTRRAHAD